MAIAANLRASNLRIASNSSVPDAIVKPVCGFSGVVWFFNCRSGEGLGIRCPAQPASSFIAVSDACSAVSAAEQGSATAPAAASATCGEVWLLPRVLAFFCFLPVRPMPPRSRGIKGHLLADTRTPH